MSQAHDPVEHRSFVIVGDTNLARRVCASLRQEASTVQHLARPGDEDLREAMATPHDAVAVLLHEDAAALRYALAVAHMRADVPIVVTVFDRTVADELLRLLPQCHVTSPADLASPALAGPCADAGIAALYGRAGRARAVRLDRAGTPCAEDWTRRRAGWRAWWSRLASQLRSHDAGTRLMLGGLTGILASLLADWVWLLGLGHPPAEALFDAARVVSTVGPATDVHSTAYQLVSSVLMLGTIVFTAMFTAGLIERMLGPRLVGLIGPRTVPRFGHVIVVGIGQVGLRLCCELRRLGIPVVGIERDPHAPNVRLARSLGIPVVAGHGGDRAVLERLHLRRARALAAVGSDDLDNITVAIAAQGVARDTRVVLRAGEHEAIAETRSLLPLGTIRDVTSLSAAYVLARLRGVPATGVITHGHEVSVRLPDGGFAPWPLAAREGCAHVETAVPA
ncbi:potassium channel family protein [Nocardiopsis aegyptia]|uniref:Voltage-gated potassium channel Kch n=1 Tax=Nocardiopsis aegyptia TaxID=220378 RepID=A0A7Z0EIU8_9ACTN|nr:NAD(P)-binding protein [Nocardiopsis aegyptia]NYJ32902.1 voltage-gated potassium channel Kch [Nocardiopsis aegyptia]